MIICAITGLMRTKETCAANKKVQPNSKAKASVKALWNQNLTPHLNEDKSDIAYYTCTVRATKTEKGFCDVDIVWTKGNFPVSPAEFMTQYLDLRMKLSQTNKALLSRPEAPLHS